MNSAETQIRDVSLVCREAKSLSSLVHIHAITLADVDNDGTNELVLGTEAGSIQVYKDFELAFEINSRISICALTVGAFFKPECDARKYIFALSPEGKLLIYLIDLAGSRLGFVKLVEKQACFFGSFMTTAIFSSQQYASIFVARADNTLSIFHPSMNENDDPSQEPSLRVFHSYELLPPVETPMPSMINSISVVQRDGVSTCICALYDGTLALVDEKGTFTIKELDANLDSEHTEQEFSCWVSREHHDMIAYCSMDGAFGLLDAATLECKQKVDLHKPWIGIGAMPLPQRHLLVHPDPMSEDGDLVLCASSWDGTTVFMNHANELMRFQLRQEIVAFAAGAHGQGSLVAYATLDEHLYLCDASELPLFSITDTRQCLKKAGFSTQEAATALYGDF